MGVARSGYDAEPEGKPRDEEIVAEFRAFTDDFEGHGYRRVGAELRCRGFVVHAEKVRRRRREHDLNPRRRRRVVRTTDSDHDGPTHAFAAKDSRFMAPTSTGSQT